MGDNQGGIGSKVWGAFKIVRGLGDMARGNALHMIDSFGSNELHQEALQRHQELAVAGRRTYEEGCANLRGGPVSTTAGGETQTPAAGSDAYPQPGTNQPKDADYSAYSSSTSYTGSKGGDRQRSITKAQPNDGGANGYDVKRD